MTNSPVMYGENFRLHGPGVMPDDVILDSVSSMDYVRCKITVNLIVNSHI